MDLVVLKGGGDLASGVAHRLHRAHFGVVITELAQPLAVRRGVAFATAVREGEIEIEGVRARRASDALEAMQLVERGEIGVIVDSCVQVVSTLKPRTVVDAIMAKRNLGTGIHDAPVVIALGPGFTAGMDCHAVVETNRGQNLGRVYYTGKAETDSKEPAPVRGVTHARVLRAPRDGYFESGVSIGLAVKAGAIVGRVDGSPVLSAIAGIVRGLVADGTPVGAGMKIGDIDPSGSVALCYTISDKSRAIGGGVLEAILHLRGERTG